MHTTLRKRFLIRFTDRPTGPSGPYFYAAVVQLPCRRNARRIAVACPEQLTRGSEGERALTDVANVVDTTSTYVVGPVGLATQASRLSPLPLSGVRLARTGWWGQWQARNRLTTLPYGISALESAGNLDNFRRILGETDAPYRGFVFNDTDIYKTLEAIAWCLAGHPDPALDSYIDSVAQLLSKVQDRRRLSEQLRAGSAERREVLPTRRITRALLRGPSIPSCGR